MSTIESMLHSVRNSTAVQEELNQLDDLFKLVEGISERLRDVDDEVHADDQWFEQLDEKVFHLNTQYTAGSRMLSLTEW